MEASSCLSPSLFGIWLKNVQVGFGQLEAKAYICRKSQIRQLLMKYTVANPIYDCVFKFLMEDERIAKTVLSALLKKEVVSVEMRRNEHPNVTRDKISMFRIDFAARIREDNGKEHLVLIELQKTWVETETLRFRRYLAAQYNAEENILKEEPDKGYGIPMIAIYLLGHRIGDIDNAVIYVSRRTLDYDGHEIQNGENDPFISSLTHDSIIVQIPLLHGKVNNKLDKVLSVFDQSRCEKYNQQIVSLDMDNYANDADLMYMVHRLGLATMSADVRQEMNDEDEFYSVLEARDTQVMQLNQTISDKNAQISKQNSQINKQSAQISEQSAQIDKQSAQLSEQSAQIKSMALAMLKNGLSKEMIANTISRSVEELDAILGCS